MKKSWHSNKHGEGEAITFSKCPTAASFSLRRRQGHAITLA
jgi:hypothetical protein